MEVLVIVPRIVFDDANATEIGSTETNGIYGQSTFELIRMILLKKTCGVSSGKTTDSLLFTILSSANGLSSFDDLVFAK